MTTIDMLREAETDLAALAGLPGEIRAKVKAGVAELTRIRDAIEATIADLTGKASDTLASLQSLATPEPSGAAASPAATPVTPAPAPETAPAAGSFAA